MSAGISGLIMAIYYLAFGRIWPMVVAQHLRDALESVDSCVGCHTTLPWEPTRERTSVARNRATDSVALDWELPGKALCGCSCRTRR